MEVKCRIWNHTWFAETSGPWYGARNNPNTLMPLKVNLWHSSSILVDIRNSTILYVHLMAVIDTNKTRYKDLKPSVVFTHGSREYVGRSSLFASKRASIAIKWITERTSYQVLVKEVSWSQVPEWFLKKFKEEKKTLKFPHHILLTCPSPCRFLHLNSTKSSSKKKH